MVLEPQVSLGAVFSLDSQNLGGLKKIIKLKIYFNVAQRLSEPLRTCPKQMTVLSGAYHIHSRFQRILSPKDNTQLLDKIFLKKTTKDTRKHSTMTKT